MRSSSAIPLCQNGSWADIESKRKLLSLALERGDQTVLGLLASPYAAHYDYDLSDFTGARDHSDVT